MLDLASIIGHLRTKQVQLATEGILAPADRTEFGFGALHGRAVAYGELIAELEQARRDLKFKDPLG